MAARESFPSLVNEVSLPVLSSLRVSLPSPRFQDPEEPVVVIGMVTEDSGRQTTI